MKHVLFKTGVGVGLMATSLGALASGQTIGLHSFGDAEIYAKSAGTPLYAAFIPSGNQSTDSVILLELIQGTGTAPGTWQYFISNGAMNSAGDVPGSAYELSIYSTDNQTVWGVTNTSVTSGYTPSTSFYGGVGNFTTASGSSASANVKASNGEILNQFSYSTAVSSATCSISFNAYVGTNDYMQYQIQAFNTGGSSLGWNSILGASSTVITNADAYTMTTKSGGANTDTTSGTNFGKDFGGNLAGYGTSYPIIPTYSYAILSVANGPAANPTLTGTAATGAGVFKTMNVCSNVVNSRIALNNSGLVVGGKIGMIRIW